MKTEPENIPQELKNYPQWVAWKSRPKNNGKNDKLPVNPHSGDFARSNDPDTWGTFEEAHSYYLKHKDMSGVGFVFNDNNIVGVDLDNCINSNGVAPWAMKIVTDFNSYAEISPSGTGIKIFCKGSLPGGGIKKGNIEMYEKGRFFTVTGNLLPGVSYA